MNGETVEMGAGIKHATKSYLLPRESRKASSEALTGEKLYGYKT